MNINEILAAKDIKELLHAIEVFCKDSILRDDDTECMELKLELETADGNDYFAILSSYMVAAEDGDEVIEALYEFLSNCKAFVEEDEESTEQITKEEFEAVLDECEDKCGVASCIEAKHTINIADIPMLSRCVDLCMREKNNIINVFLPKYNTIAYAEKDKYIADIIGTLLYKVVSKRLKSEYILQEIHRYIPASRTMEKSAKELFVDYFYAVIKYRDRKPGIYTHFDKHMERVIILEFYRGIIQEYFRSI